MYGLKAINDEATECEVCGKVELKRVMWIVELDTDNNEQGNPFAVGTTCGSKLLSYTQSKVNTICNTFEHNVYQAKQALINSHPASKEANELIKQLNAITPRLSYAERKVHPMYIQMKEKQAEAKAYADSQNIVIGI